MRRILAIAILLLASGQILAQEVKSTIQVVAPRVQMTNKQILATLQNAMQQFVNNRKWTEDNFEAREKIEVSIFFEVQEISTNNDFKATVQVQSVRPVFNSGYKSTVFSFSDEEVYFSYREGEGLEYQENQNMNDLTSLLAYYTNIAIGYDYDSFGELGGSPFFTRAQSIVSLMTGKPGWNQGDGKGFRNRYFLAENLNNLRFQAIRKFVYAYHRKGMDQMYEKPEAARTAITDAMKSLQEQVTSIPNSLLQKTFFNTKWSELVEIYKGGTVPEKNNALSLLAQLDPVNRQRYEKIKN
ncbi:MAG: DUF4835 family protein [Bacteroidetes bacterium]|nr:DUF4835 family protein [Bacteroidota bacterium]